MTTASDRAEFRRRAWLAVEKIDRDGSQCEGCYFNRESGPAADEPYSRECMLPFSDDDPARCPAIDLEAIRDELDAEREDYEDSRRAGK